MTGFFGEISTPANAECLSEHLYWEDWYEAIVRTSGDATVGVAKHGGKDRISDTVWRNDDRMGVLHGVVSNETARSMETSELFEGVLDRPDAVLPTLEGPFAIGVIDTDANRAVVATDKVGSRPCYYTDAEGFAFSSEVSPLVSLQNSPTVDSRAVADLLAYGAVVGEKTVLEGIDTLPPATYLAFEDGESTTTRYWRPGFRVRSHEAYVDDWLDHHEGAIENLVATVDDDLTLWLSGGIDSRVTAGALHRAGCEFDALTYATGEGGNRRLAEQVADQLGAAIGTVPTAFGSGEDFVDGVRKSVFALDAMSSWAYVPAIPFVFEELPDLTDVAVEGGTFLGEDVFSYYTSNAIPAPETLYRKRHLLPEEDVTSMLTASVDPRRSLRSVVERTAGDTPPQRSTDGMRQLYAYLHMRSNIPIRSQVGTRVVCDGQFLDHVLAMPDEYRLGTVPFTDGEVPLGVSRMKLEAVRGIDRGLEDIGYERSGVAPVRSYWLHLLGAGVKKLASAVRDQAASGYLRRYQDDDTVRDFVDSLVADARERPFFESDELADLHEQIHVGRNLVPVAAVVGLELWLQRHHDPRQ